MDGIRWMDEWDRMNGWMGEWDRMDGMRWIDGKIGWDE